MKVLKTLGVFVHQLSSSIFLSLQKDTQVMWKTVIFFSRPGHCEVVSGPYVAHGPLFEYGGWFDCLVGRFKVGDRGTWFREDGGLTCGGR